MHKEDSPQKGKMPLKMSHVHDGDNENCIKNALEEKDNEKNLDPDVDAVVALSFATATATNSDKTQSKAIDQQDAGPDTSPSPIPEKSDKRRSSKKLQSIPVVSPELLNSSVTATASASAAAATAVINAATVSSNADDNLVLTQQSTILDALIKVQTCILMLSSAIGRLYDNLKVILPGSTNSIEESENNASDSSDIENSVDMLQGMCPRSGKKLSPRQSQISLENNNTNKRNSLDKIGSGGGDFTNGKKKDAVVDIVNSGKLPTDFPETPIIPEDNLDKLKKPPPLFARILSRCLKYVGLLFALFASVCMSLVTLVVKFMEGYHPVSKVIWRLQGVLLPSLALVLYFRYRLKRPLITWRNGGQDKSSYWKIQIFILLVARGVVGCSADIFQYYSLKFLPLADSTVISFSTPIFVCIVAHFVLHEKCGVVPIFTAVLTLCGVIVIAKPPILTGEEEMSSNMLLGNILAIMCMISGTITTVLMRYLQHVHFSVTMLALGVFGTIEGFVVTLFTSPFELPYKNFETDWLLAIFTAGVFFLGQLSMTLALQHEEAGVVSLVRTCDVLFAFVWQVFFLHQEANMYSYIGALIVTLGVCITALRKWLNDLPERNAIRKRFSFILR